MPPLLLDPHVAADVEELLALSDAEYRDEIDKLLRAGEKDPDWDVVMSAGLVQRTKLALREIRAEVPDYGSLDRLYRRTLARKCHHAQIAVLIKAQREERAEKTVARRTIGDLAAAVAAHRSAVLAAGYEPEDHDLDLWRTLASLSINYGTRPFTLDEALGAGKWAPGGVPDAD